MKKTISNWIVIVLFVFILAPLLMSCGGGGERPSPNARLNGAFHIATFILGTTSVSEIGTITFDGAGNHTITGTYSESGAVIDQPYTDSGTYAVSPDGTFTFTTTVVPTTYTGAIKGSGDILVFSNVSEQNEQAIGIAVKAGTAGFSATSLDGEYHIATLAEGTASTISEIGTIEFDGAGNHTISTTYSDSGVGNNLDYDDNGTYAVSPDGTFTFTTTVVSTTYTGAIKDTGGILIFSNVSETNEQAIGVAVKAGTGGFANGSLNGGYRIATLTRGPTWSASDIGTITFNGTGTHTIAGTYSDSAFGSNEPYNDSGIYAVSADGTLTSLTITETYFSEFAGGIIDTGGIVIFSNVLETDEQVIGVAVKVSP